jgi:ribosomal protein S27E
MQAEKYSRSVNMLCPTCGGDQFAFEGEGEAVQSVKCASCGRELSKDELIELNNENISEHVKEMGKEITQDIAKELRGALKNVLRGGKNITFK